MELRVLSWNLMHGRSVPGSGRDLLPEFTDALSGWDWDIALLQEVPPWWPAGLARALGCEQRAVLTSRNAALPVRRWVARRAPDLIKSNGGGADAILARSDRIAFHASRQLTRWPERRQVHAVQLGCGVWVGNLHATAHDTAAAQRDATAAAAALGEWATGVGGARPVILGGDFNLRDGELQTLGGRGDLSDLAVLASRDVDHILGGEGVRPAGAAQRLERGTLSDHVPLALSLEVDVP